MQNLTANLATIAKAKHLQTTPSSQCELHAKQQNELQQRMAQTTDKLCAELLPVLVLYYPIFAAQHCSDAGMVQAVMGQFAERMVVMGVTRKEFYAGIEQLKKRAGASAFVLNPQAFAELCKASSQGEALVKLPTLSSVQQAIVEFKQLNTFGLNCPLATAINSRIGVKLQGLTPAQMMPIIQSEYEHFARRYEIGDRTFLVTRANQSELDLPDYLKNPATPTTRYAKLAAKRAQGEVNAC